MTRRRDILRGLVGGALAFPAVGQVAGWEAAAELPVPPAPVSRAESIGGEHLRFPNVERVRAARIAAADGGVRSLETSGYHAAGDGGGALYRQAPSEPAHPGKVRSADGAWWEIAEPVVESKMLGAVCDGVTDDTEAIGALSEYLAAHPGAHVRLSPGVSLFRGGFTFAGGGTLSGYGKDSSRLKMAVGGSELLYRAPGAPPIADLTLRDFTLEGDWGGADHADTSLQNDRGSHLVVLYSIDRLTISRMRFEYARLMAVAVRASDIVSIRDCEVRCCARDGLNCARSHRVLINDNTIDHVDDDAIAVHMEETEPEPTHKEAVITGNRISDSQGIKIIGLQRATITGNQIERCRFNGIMMDPSPTFPEGENPIFAVTITGNVITDMIDRNGIDGLNATANYIFIEGKAAQAEGLAAPPGRHDTATGTIIPLYEHLSNVGSSRPTPDSFGFVVANNICTRTLPVTANYTDYGYGEMFLRSGWADPAMTLAELQNEARGITLKNVRDVIAEGNYVSGMAGGITLSSGGHHRNILIRGNIVRMFISGGIVSTDTNYQHIIAEGNTLDGDPMHEHANRNANGTWDDVATGSAFRVLGSGIIARGNHIKNVPRVNDAIGGDRFWEENFLYCEPAAAGYNASNKGIGNCPRVGAKDFLYVIMDSDPASANYDTIKNMCATSTNTGSPPSSGTYVIGHKVEDKFPNIAGGAGSQYVLMGWLRLTTGSGHRMGVDWVELRAPTGT